MREEAALLCRGRCQLQNHQRRMDSQRQGLVVPVHLPGTVLPEDLIQFHLQELLHSLQVRGPAITGGKGSINVFPAVGSSQFSGGSVNPHLNLGGHCSGVRGPVGFLEEVSSVVVLESVMAGSILVSISPHHTPH